MKRNSRLIICNMFMAVAVVIASAVIKVTVGEVSEKAFQQTTGLANVQFADGQVIAGTRSQLHCAIICSQYTWCNTIGWSEDTSTCQGFTRTLSQEATPASVSDVYVIEGLYDGYTYELGMYIKFFADQTAVTWQQAEDVCVGEGGRLVVADTLDKFNYIQNQLKTDPVLSGITAWLIGCEKIFGTWTWTTGQTLSPAIPVYFNLPLSEFCLGFYTADLHDVPCIFTANFICEK